MNNWFKYANGMINLDNVWKISKGNNKEGKPSVTFHCIEKEIVSFSFDDDTKMNEFYERIQKSYTTADIIEKVATNIENRIDEVIDKGFVSVDSRVRFDYDDEHITGIENNLEWTQEALNNIDDKLKNISENISNLKDNK